MYYNRSAWYSSVSVVVITSANTHDMKKAATETLDSVIVERPLNKQNLSMSGQRI